VLWSAPLASSYIRGIDDVGDVNGDTLHDIAVMTQQPGKFVVLNGDNGAVLFEYVFGTSISQRGDRVIAINSIDTNLSKEMIAGCRDGRIKCFSGGSNTAVGISSNNQHIPDKFVLNQNYPNPFNPATKINFSVSGYSFVKLKVFDILGREVAVLVNENLSAGNYNVVWNAGKFATGVYFYELSAADYRDVKKMILVK
jgi:hypothetical protein